MPGSIKPWAGRPGLPEVHRAEDARGALGGRLAVGSAPDVRRERRLIRIVDARDVADLSGPRPPVDSFDVAPLAYIDGSVHVDFQKVSDPPPVLVALPNTGRWPRPPR